MPIDRKKQGTRNKYSYKMLLLPAKTFEILFGISSIFLSQSTIEKWVAYKMFGAI